MSPWHRHAIADGVAVAADDLAPAARVADRLRTVEVYVLAALLMFGVLAFGAVENWAVFVMATGATALLTLWSAEQIVTNQLEVTRSPLFIPLAGLGAVIFIQYVTRTTAYLYATRLSLLTAITLGILCFVATQVLVLRHHRERLTIILAVFGFVVAIIAVLQHFTAPEKIYWTLLPPDAGLVFGPYVNRNHFAGCMELLMPCALVPAFDRHYSLTKRALLSFMAVMMCAAVFLSQSRAGSAALLLEMIFFAVLFKADKRRRAMVGTLALLLVVSAAMGLWLSSGRALDRFGDVHDLRLRITRDTLRMIPQHPWLGWGAGTYEAVYGEFRSYTSRFVVDHAHNDYLEALVETGIIGFSMVVAFVIILYRRAWQALRSSSWSPTRPRVAALVGCTGLLVHSFTDFNMHIPANAALFMVMAAMAMNTSLAKYGPSTRQIYWEGKDHDSPR
jgi:O-antigen ligase